MFRCLIAAVAMCALVAVPALAEDQIRTTQEFRVASKANPHLQYTLNTEVRFRQDGGLSEHIFRPGLAYRLRDSLTISGGYRYANAQRTGPDRIEHRFWQQASYNLAGIGRGQLLGRTRFEQRWRDGADDTGLRLRQQFAYEHPIGDTGLDAGLSNEFIFGLNETDWGQSTGLGEIRARAVVKWNMFDAGWEVGYMYQYRNGTGGADDEHNDHILIGLSKSI